MSITRWNPKQWAGLMPNGLGQTKPNHYLDMAKIVWRNRDQLPYAWRILSQGVCDGCALGTAGLHDFTMEGVHLCMVRLELLRLNTAPALDENLLTDAAPLARLNSTELRELGRLPYPMLRRAGEGGFTRITWDKALDLAAQAAAATAPERLAFFLTSRGLTNESYYVAQKVARFLGTNNVDNSARICHAPSTVAMKQALGVAASTVSYRDWLGTDLMVFFGSNTPNNQPVTTKYLYYAKQQGTRIAVINPYREPGLERYWVPSVTESALFGTKLADEFFQVHTGGDRAFIAGVLKHLLEQNWTNETFIAQHTTGFAELKAALRAYEWEMLEAAAGTTRAEMLRFARLLAEAKNAIFVWSMGITQHADGVANVRAIIDLALSRGFIGKPHSGLVPIRGHSGVQGGAEVGCVPNQFALGVPADEAGAARMQELWGFTPPTAKGLNAVQMLEAAHAGELDWFYQSGGNFLETLPDPAFVRDAVARIPVRIHQDIILSPQMFIEPRELVLLLPARTRYEQVGGGTETTTERRILFSPEIPGPRIGEARNEWEIPMLIAERTRVATANLIHFADGQAIRDEIARVVPAYKGIETLRKTGDQVQWGGPRLCETPDATGQPQPHFNTPDGRAQFSVIEIAATHADGKLRLSTRRGKQFNSMVQRDRDPLNGAHREDILLSAADADRLGLREGDALRLHNENGELHGRCRLAPLTPGNVQVHWPEGNVLLKRGVCDPECGIPDYNTLVRLERLA